MNENEFPLASLGTVAGLVPDLVKSFNKDYQRSQVEIAQANAQIARANADAQTAQQPNYLLWLVIVAVIVIAFLIIRKIA